MERFTNSPDDQLAHAFDHLVAMRGCRNCSEAVRGILRGHLARLCETYPADKLKKFEIVALTADAPHSGHRHARGAQQPVADALPRSSGARAAHYQRRLAYLLAFRAH